MYINTNQNRETEEFYLFITQLIFTNIQLICQ